MHPLGWLRWHSMHRDASCLLVIAIFHRILLHWSDSEVMHAKPTRSTCKSGLRARLQHADTIRLTSTMRLATADSSVRVGGALRLFAHAACWPTRGSGHAHLPLVLFLQMEQILGKSTIVRSTLIHMVHMIAVAHYSDMQGTMMAPPGSTCASPSFCHRSPAHTTKAARSTCWLKTANALSRSSSYGRSSAQRRGDNIFVNRSAEAPQHSQQQLEEVRPQACCEGYHIRWCSVMKTAAQVGSSDTVRIIRRAKNP
jgi:hypothetical protein